MINYKQITFAFLFIFANNVKAQDIWTQLDNVNGAPKSACVGFSVNGEGYIALGLDEYFERDQLYSYDVFWDDWDNEEELGNAVGLGLERSSAVSFSIGNLAYVGLGSSTGDAYFGDFWEYNPATNSWSQLANFDGTARRQAVGFSIGSKGYVGTGVDENGDYRKDFWEYDPSANTWNQLNDFGGSARQSAVGFSMGGYGYLGTGDDGTPTKDFWQYDPASDQWTQKQDFPGSERAGAIGFGFYPQGFIATGYDINFEYTDDVWEYNAEYDFWTQRNDFPGVARTKAVAFTIGNLAYVGTGYNDNYLDDFWSYSPLCLPDSSQVTESACSYNGFTWINGSTYFPADGNGPWYHTIPSGTINGCDSVISLSISWEENDTTLVTMDECSTGFTWDNGVTYSSVDGNGPWYHAYPGSGLCDSVVELTVNWIYEDTTFIQSTECSTGFTWVDGNTYTPSDGNGPWYMSYNGSGVCDSIVELIVTWNYVNTSITVNGSTLTSDAPLNNTFQWVDCDNNFSAIPGETNQSFTPTNLSGNYAVITSDGLCQDTSECEYVSYVGIDENNPNYDIVVYPNPTYGTINVQLSNLDEPNLTVYNLSGKRILEFNDIEDELFKFQLDQPAGFYVIEIKNQGTIKRFKLTKK
ncbi:MAG: T9SS type A sorting domain-containing protein [Crocinitomicaceae bacterium]|nr:T9SS type A sorting domain-containing protein [Crocinitomicaceae bacterium]